MTGPDFQSVKFFTITLSESELAALGNLMLVSRAIVGIIGGHESDYGQKLMALAQTVEDVIQRIEDKP